MLLKLPVVGSGVPDDPYRVNYPHYEMREIDYDNLVAIVEVPDRTLPVDFRASFEHLSLPKGDLNPKLPDDPKTGKPQKAPQHVHQNVITSAHPDEIAAWHEHLDTMYAEHAGKFRPLA